MTEVRLRAGKPVDLFLPQGHLFLGKRGQTFHKCHASLPIITQAMLEDCFLSLCDYSIHTHQQDIAQGFLTLRGGHRAGIGGTCVWEEGKPAGIRDISSICLRIARAYPGSGEQLAGELLSTSGGMLIAGKPGSGKTTLLRELARRLADGLEGCYYRVTVVDERGELAAVSGGEPQHDLGACCDILSNFSKRTGVEMAVRTLSPDFIVCDELGGDDVSALRQSVCRGVRMIAAIHAKNLSELTAREGVPELLETGAFSRIAFLEGGVHPGRISRIVPISRKGADAH